MRSFDVTTSSLEDFREVLDNFSTREYIRGMKRRNSSILVLRFQVFLSVFSFFLSKGLGRVTEKNPVLIIFNSHCTCVLFEQSKSTTSEGEQSSNKKFFARTS